MNLRKRFISGFLALGLVTSSMFISNVNAQQLEVNHTDVGQGDSKDDITGHWAESPIRDFTNRGYVNGYPDGTFKPNNYITRAEFVTIMNNYFGLTKSSGKVFNDTKIHWAKSAIDIAVANGVCNGISDTDFAPDAPITREQSAKMIANYKKISDSEHDKINKYYDNEDISSWAKDAVEAITEVGYMNGYSNTNTFKPKNNITRAESVTLLNNIINPNNDIIVNIPDKNLKTALNMLIDPERNSDYDIKKTELASIKNAELGAKNIENIEGIQYMTNLESLSLSLNKIKSIKQLKNLEKLRYLDISNNEVRDLENLPKVFSQLNISYNGIEDISKMNVDVPTTLNLSNNKITDISNLKIPSFMSELNLSNNQIEDIGPLSKLQNIRDLYLYNNKIKDVSPLRKDANLININLDDNEIVNISPLPSYAHAAVPEEDGGHRTIKRQNVILPKISVNGNSLIIENPSFDLNLKNVDIIEISDGGRIEGNKIIWDDLTQSKNLSFKFSNKWNFDGTVTQPIELIK